MSGRCTRAMTAPREALLTVKEYADLTRRTPQAVYTAIREDRVPYPVERPTGGGILIRVPVTVLRAGGYP